MQRESDISHLEAATHSTDPTQHTEMATLQRINQALLIELRTQQETNQILRGQTLQQIVGQKVQQEEAYELCDVGRAEAIDYRNFQYRPQEAENKYYLSRWAELYFSRNGFTIERDQMNALYFLNGDVQRQVIDQERKDNAIQNYQRDSGLPFVDLEVKNVVLDDLRQSPYSARVEFEKVFTNPTDHSEVKRERWTATVTYDFSEKVKNNELVVNPLGLRIVRFRVDQAFS